MSLDFKSGNYAVQTGKTFSDPGDATHGYYALRFTSKLDPSMTSSTASLRQENDTYFADWTLSDNILSYEGVKGNLQEQECLLIFDEETQSFTLERPVLKTTLKKRKRKPIGSTSNKQKAKSKATASTSKNNEDATQQQQQNSSVSLALPPQQKPKDTQGTVPANDNSDSFDDDILRDMDEILNSNNDDDDDNDDNDEFETITTPHMASNDPMGSTPLSSSPRPVVASSPGNQQLSSTTGNRRRHVLRMASAPIRRLDSSPPTPAPTTTSSSTAIPPSSPSSSNNRPRTSGKTISAETLAARRKAASAIRSDSSSGSSSSGSDSSSDDGSGSSGSSASDSDSDDDDMDLLAANISRGLSEDEARRPSHPPPTRPDGTTPNYMRHTPDPLTPSNRGSNSNTPGPTSLRDLLGKGDQRDDDDVSSSDSSDNDM